nr:hypothetical protein [Tanacetum cinerariifolium]
MRRIIKGFSGVETPLFDTMLVQPQVQDAAKVEEDEDDELSAAPTPPSPTPAPTSSPPQQESIPSPPQSQPAQPLSPIQQQPTQPADNLKFSMTFLNTLMETWLNPQMTLWWMIRRMHPNRGEITELDADEDVTLVDVDVDIQEKMEENVTAVKEVNVAEPTVFDDEEVTMTMAQTLIKMKAKKQRIIDEQMAKMLQDKKIEQADAREKQEKEDLKRAKVLQQQYDQKQESINWNVVAEHMQEKHLDNIKKYQSLKRKSISVAQARKNMVVYLKNMVGYKIQHFKGSRTYWRTIRVGGITQAFQSFEDMLKYFDREDLDALWRIKKEKFSTAMPIHVKEKALWAELTRLYEPNADDVF